MQSRRIWQTFNDFTMKCVCGEWMVLYFVETDMNAIHCHIVPADGDDDTHLFFPSTTRAFLRMSVHLLRSCAQCEWRRWRRIKTHKNLTMWYFWHSKCWFKWPHSLALPTNAQFIVQCEGTFGRKMVSSWTTPLLLLHAVAFCWFPSRHAYSVLSANVIGMHAWTGGWIFERKWFTLNDGDRDLYDWYCSVSLTVNFKHALNGFAVRTAHSHTVNVMCNVCREHKNTLV